MGITNCGEGGHGGAGSELDSHANMIVAGEQAYVFSESGVNANVRAFSDEASGMQGVPIVDCMWAYDCAYSGLTYMLVARNALSVPSMDHNLFPAFILREAGLVVNETAKIHCDNPSVENHSIFDEESGLRIPLSLNGIFSVFQTRAPSEKEIEEIENYQTIFITPDSNVWDPYNESYRINEDSLVDFRGDISRRSRGTKRSLLQVDVSAMNADCDSNDVGLPTDNVDQPTWRENMLRKRLLRKRNEKLQRISKEKGEAEFEFNVASAMLSDADNLPPSDILSVCI